MWDLFVNMEGLAGWVGGNFRKYGYRCGVGNNCGPCYRAVPGHCSVDCRKKFAEGLIGHPVQVQEWWFMCQASCPQTHITQTSAALVGSPPRKSSGALFIFKFKDLFILFLCMLVLVCMCVYVCTCTCACTHACCPWRSEKGTGSPKTEVTSGYKLPIVSAKN